MKCYEILDVQPGVTGEMVRKAYIELAHVWDPEKHPGNPLLRQVAEEKRKEIDAAYNALQAFLPDLRHGSPAQPARPERPADAITDAPLTPSTPRTSSLLYILLFFLMMSLIILTCSLFWRSVPRAPAASTVAAPE